MGSEDYKVELAAMHKPNGERPEDNARFLVDVGDDGAARARDALDGNRRRGLAGRRCGVARRRRCDVLGMAGDAGHALDAGCESGI